jgi:Putative Actinobacterial Holin-X, holin superfamily III
MRLPDMADKEITTPTPQLIDDLIKQLRQLASSEIDLLKSELAQSAGSLTLGVSALAAGAGIVFAGLVVLLTAGGFFLVRLGAPPDVAFLIVALAALLGGWLLIRSGGKAIQPGRLLPRRSLSQISALLGRR